MPLQNQSENAIMMHMHRYLFTLQIVPLEVGKMYPELPSHLTLMSRFLSELSADDLARTVQSVFDTHAPVVIEFEQTTQLGPKKLTVHMVNSASERALHNALLHVLQSLGAQFEYPDFIGAGHKPHVTKRPGMQFNAGETYTSTTVYLIEIVESKRLVRAAFHLK